MRRGMHPRCAQTRTSSIAVVRGDQHHRPPHYSIRSDGIRLFMFNDRLEIHSPGRLPGHVTLENLVESATAVTKRWLCSAIWAISGNGLRHRP